MSEEQQTKALMVVVTRGYATRDGANDEFVQEWGFSNFKDNGDKNNFQWGDKDESVYLLVVHGHEDKSPVEFIEAALNNFNVNSLDQNTIWLFYHSVKDVEGSKLAICRAFGTQIEQIQNHYYASGGGGPAVEGLLRILDEKKDTKLEFTDFTMAVEKAATGRVLFVNRLHQLQSCLLRLRLAFEAVLVSDGKFSPIINPDVFFETTEAVYDTVGKIFEKGENWLDWLMNPDFDRGGEVAAAIGWIEELYIPESVLWDKYNEDCGWIDSIEGEEGKEMKFRNDITHFARALDVLLDAAESLPQKRPVEMGKEQES